MPSEDQPVQRVLCTSGRKCSPVHSFVPLSDSLHRYPPQQNHLPNYYPLSSDAVHTMMQSFDAAPHPLQAAAAAAQSPIIAGMPVSPDGLYDHSNTHHFSTKKNVCYITLPPSTSHATHSSLSQQTHLQSVVVTAKSFVSQAPNLYETNPNLPAIITKLPMAASVGAATAVVTNSCDVWHSPLKSAPFTEYPQPQPQHLETRITPPHISIQCIQRTSPSLSPTTIHSKSLLHSSFKTFSAASQYHFSVHQLKVLEHCFSESEAPSSACYQRISERLSIPRSVVMAWFQKRRSLNRRARESSDAEAQLLQVRRNRRSDSPSDMVSPVMIRKPVMVSRRVVVSPPPVQVGVDVKSEYTRPDIKDVMSLI
ncbi:hypothetical protein BJ741DRAFT_714283 [Chytriomyces cf. hyalinus JEL632]|nr:hypothetical protein BJ741DRAFT_714283 [Chytriomyces cf. hyalinus JEL632]